jgi:hypothetical protein
VGDGIGAGSGLPDGEEETEETVACQTARRSASMEACRRPLLGKKNMKKKMCRLPRFV